ncbi:MAG: hypothetical protein ABH834_05265 [Candidatus Altiarchaeota archaeon]
MVGSTQAALSYLTGPNVMTLGNEAVVEATTDGPTNVSYTLLNPANASVTSGSSIINGSLNISFNSTYISSVGNWTAVFSDNQSSFSLSFTVIEPIQFTITLVESVNHNASRVVRALTPNVWNVGAGFSFRGLNPTKSGVMRYGVFNESDLSCDVNGDGALNKTIYIWTSDRDEAGSYNTVFIDDDAVLNESTETGVAPKTYLTVGDTTVKCSGYTDIAPFIVEHVNPSEMVLVLPPGPGDRPYGAGSRIDGIVYSYNASGHIVPANITSFKVRYTNVSSSLIVEMDFNSVLSSLNKSLLNQTLSDGFSNPFDLNASAFMNELPSSGPGEYVLIIDDYSTEAFRLVPSWTAKVIVGDPLTGTDKYDFRAGDSVAVGVETSASSSNLLIHVSVYNPYDNLTAKWTYSGTDNADGIYYDNNSKVYVAGVNPVTLEPSITVLDEGDWHVEVTVTSGSDERFFERSFVVKSYELSVFSIILPEGGDAGDEPQFNVMKPGGKAFIGVFATSFGVHGDLRDNMEDAEVQTVDADPEDAVNECNTSLVSLRILDSDGVVLADFPGTPGLVDDVDNVYQIMETYGPGAGMSPTQFHGQCMAYLDSGPNATGYYTVEATLTVSAGDNSKNATGDAVVQVQNAETNAEPWDITSNNPRWHFNPQDNVTFKVEATNLFTGEEIPSANFVSLNLIEVFNTDYGGPVTDLIESYGWIKDYDLGGEASTILWLKLGNTTGFHNIEYEATVTLNASGTLQNATVRGYSGVETSLYDINGHPNFERNTNYFRPDEDIDFIVEVWSPNGPAVNVSVFIDSIVSMKDQDYQANFTAARATTDSNGRANVTIRPTSGYWQTGEYDVRIRVKDTQNNVDYGWGWFEVKTFQVLVIPVRVSENGTRCSTKNLGRDRMGDEDEMEKGGPPQITDNQVFAVVGVNKSGTFTVNPLLEKSYLFQITNLNGEPVFRDIQSNTSNLSSCNLTSSGLVTTTKYFTLYTQNLGGMYEFKVVSQDSGGRLGTGHSEFFVTPFELSVYLMQRGEPVFSKGDVLTFRAEAGSGFNVTGVSVVRLVKVGGQEQVIPGASSAMTPSIVWVDNVSSSRRFRLTIPSNVSGIKKGEYVIQIEVTVTDASGGNQSLVYNQWVMIRSFTYSMANMLRSWADTFNTTEAYNMGYGCTADGYGGSECVNESYARGQYSFNYESCPYPIINESQRCAFINATDLRNRVYDLWSDCSDCIEKYNQFIGYYNKSGNMTLFNGFNLIVGPITFERASAAKVYLVYADSQLQNDTLTPLSTGDVIVDASGMAFRISEIKQWEIKLKPVSFARTWDIRSLKFNNTGKTISGAVKVGVIREGEVRIDFNGDGNFSEEWDFGLPYILFDPANDGVYDTARVDSDMDLDFDDEQDMVIGGAGIQVSIGNKIRNMYLVKADNFDVIFAFNESGSDDWMGTHRKNTNITIPIYSKTRGLNLSVIRVIEDRRRIAVTNFTAYNTTVGADGIGLLTVSIPSSGQYSILYQISDENGTQSEVPEQWDAPHVQVRSFDTSMDIFMEVEIIPAFTRLSGNASRMMWWESQGYQKEWFNTNGSILEGLLASLPSNISGYLGDVWPYLTHADHRGYVLYDRNSGNIFVKNTTNFTGVSAASLGEIAYTVTQRYPNRDEPDDILRNITFTFTGKRCWDDGCQIVLGESQPTPTLQAEQTPAGGSRGCYEVERVGELCEFGFNVPRSSLMPLWINNTGLNETVIYVITNVSRGPESLGGYLNRSSVAISVDSSGQPNNTQTVTVRGDTNEEDWCSNSVLGCVGGEYIASIRIINATWENGEHEIQYEISEYYNNSDIWANTAVDSNTTLIGPSDNYYVRYVSWKGVWMALDTTNQSDLKLYLSSDANFSGEQPYPEGDDIPLYDKWFNDTANFRLLSLTPKNYGAMLVDANRNYSFEGTVMWIWSINTTSNGTRFYATDCQDCEIGLGNDLWLGDETEMAGLRVRLNDILNDTTVNMTVWINTHTARWGYDTTGLSQGLNASFYDRAYQKMVGNIVLGADTYNVIIIDSNSSESDTDFTHVFLTNDTVLETGELRILGNTTPFSGTDYYLSSIDGDRVVILGNAVDIVGVPYSDDGLGYFLSVAEPVQFSAGPYRPGAPSRGSPLRNNTGRNYTFIMYAEDRGDEASELGRIMVDDDSLWVDEADCSGDSCTCFDDADGTLNESGRIAEEYGEIGRWAYMNFKVLNDSTGRYASVWYDIWDRNWSDSIRLLRRFDGWWGEYLTNESNISMGIKVADFLGNPVSGTVTVDDVIMMGEFADEWEHPLSEFNNINYTVYYDGVSGGNNTLDSDGLIVIKIYLADNTTWWEGFGYMVTLNITSTIGDSEQTDMWFDLGKRYQEEEEVNACTTVVNETVCETQTNGRCEWINEDCDDKSGMIHCSDWNGDSEGCTAPCVWIQPQDKCISCGMVEEKEDCDQIEAQLDKCTWVTEEGGECVFTGGGA